MDIEKEIKDIKNRNKKVEADKAWEQSFMRKILILITTYVVASLALYSIGTPKFYLGAIIPTLGFFLSTLSFSFFKKWWINKKLKDF